MCAEIFHRHGLRWQYEPETFTLRVDEDGRVRDAFSPDFYLPDLDLYIEVTVQRSKHLDRKRAKIRQLRALHPELRVILLTRGEIEDLASRYGYAVPAA